VGPEIRLADHGVVAIRAAGADGEALIGAGSDLYRVRGGAIEAVDLGGVWAGGAPNAGAYVGIAGVMEPDGSSMSLEWHAVTHAFERGGGGPLDATGLRTFSISGSGRGTVVVASIVDPSTLRRQVRSWAFGASGPLVPAVDLETASAPGAMDIDGFDPAWLGYVDQDTSMVELLGVAPDGRAVGATRLAMPRAGFLGTITIAASDTRVLAMWVWRSFAGSLDLHAIEGATMRLDGTLERPCDD
jgi:hypothetical protein